MGVVKSVVAPVVRHAIWVAAGSAAAAHPVVLVVPSMCFPWGEQVSTRLDASEPACRDVGRGATIR